MAWVSGCLLIKLFIDVFVIKDGYIMRKLYEMIFENGYFL